MEPQFTQLPPPADKPWRQRLANARQAWQSRLESHWRPLKLFQKLYFFAALTLLISTELAALLAAVALVADFWPRFARAWDTLAGKAAFLLFYGAIANYAFASAAGLINEITGIDADYLPYALNTALLLKLPALAVAISVLALVMIGLFFPFYLMLMLGLRLIGVRSDRLFPNIRHPVWTMFLRFLLSWLLVVKAGDVLQPEDIEERAEAPEQTLLLNGEPDPDKVKELPEQTKKALADQDLNVIALNSDGYDSNVRRLLAQFIYHLEANQKSRCQLADQERAVELNDYQYLAIVQDKSAQSGYRYTVKACRSPGISLPEMPPLPAQ